MMTAQIGTFRHPLACFGGVLLPREAIDEVLEGYRRPNDKISEWLKDGALLPLRRGLHLTGSGLRSGPLSTGARWLHCTATIRQAGAYIVDTGHFTGP